jgi:peptide/nickel transport system substrate-binding protein
MNVRMSRRAVCAAVLAVALTATAGCGGTKSSAASGQPVAGGSLTIGAEIQPTEGLDPQVDQTFAAQTLVSQLYEGLLSLDDDANVRPGLAESYVEVNPTTYRFTLRTGVKFHDGTDLTTDDVVFSLQRMVSPELKSPFKAMYKIQSAKAVDARTVELTLSAPQPSLLNLLARPWSGAIMSKKWVTSTPPDKIKTSENGTGPFTLKEWKDGVSITMAKFADYWDKPKPYLDSVVYRLIPDESSRVSALRSNAIQMTTFRDPRAAKDAQGAGATIGKGKRVSSYWIGMNAKSGPLADERVRQAVNLAIDRKAIIKVTGNPDAGLGYMIPPGDPYGATPPDGDAAYTQNKDKARQLLRDAGKEKVSLTLMAASDASYAVEVPMLELIKAQLAEVGIDLTLDLMPFASMLPRVLNGQWADMVTLASVLNADPSQYVNTWFTKGGPMTHVDDQRLWDLMARAESTTDLAQRKALYKEISTYVAEKVYILVPVSRPARMEAWTGTVGGYTVDATVTRLQLKNTWLAK